MGCFVVPVASAVTAGCASGWLAKYAKPLRRLAICESAVGLLSAAEHVYHGEVTFAWPFLTGLATVETREVLVRELATEGVTLALVGVALWSVWSVGLAIARKHSRAAVREA